MNPSEPPPNARPLLADAHLEESGVVANCRMNRERGLAGSNGYDRELGFNPVDALCERLGADDHAGPNYTGQPAAHSYYEPTG